MRLIREAFEAVVDGDAMDKVKEREERGREALRAAAAGIDDGGVRRRRRRREALR